MSVQFGRWNFDGRPITPAYVEKVGVALEPYGPDSNEKYSKDGTTILYRAFRTTKESHHEVQPRVSPSGAVITWDGRLDNRSDLARELHSSLATDLTDLAIVAAAYERWGESCFGRLIGDWALSIWNPNNKSLLLAKDPIGTRHLYYWADSSQVTWSTILDPIVRFAEKTFDLDKEYVAGWFSFSYPALHLTPCVGIRSVPPSSWVLLQPGKHRVNKYWDFDPEKHIRYRTDAEYEEHFRFVFGQAVARKLRSDRPVLAELSGGRDSSSIVCMADAVISQGKAECPRLDTISYYDDSEPNWNERPYFTKVEEKRGRTGWHVNVAAPDTPVETDEAPSPAQPSGNCFVPNPGYNGRTPREIRKCLNAQGNRVLLSGIGGDEVMGGVPTPTPELQDLLSRGRFRALARQLKGWALQMKKPWFYLFWDAAKEFLPLSLVGVQANERQAPWLKPSFVKRYRRALTGYPERTKLFGSLPTFQFTVNTIGYMRKELERHALPFEPPVDKRFPYLDRELLEFVSAIPREQLVRPTQRRSLMRRALAGIVPDEILNRKTKAFVARAQMVAVSRDWSFLMATAQKMLSASLGIVDLDRYMEALQTARRGEEVPMIALNRTLFIEGWLKDLLAQGFIKIDAAARPNVSLQESVQS